MKITSTHILIGIVLVGFLCLIGSVAIHKYSTSKDSVSSSADLASFATCISNSGAKFYGAFWCPHCKEQKELFKNAVAQLPYIECSTADQKGQTQVCIDAQIKGYPTWEFRDGSRVSGVQTLDSLSQKTSCPFPSSH
jgi:hypothetical protein